MTPKQIWTIVVIVFPFVALSIAIWIDVMIGLKMFGSYLLAMACVILLERYLNRPEE